MQATEQSQRGNAVNSETWSIGRRRDQPEKPAWYRASS